MAEKEKGRPVYIVIPRKLMIACVTVGLVLFIGVLGSYQYANYVSRQLCGVISVSNESYKENPPTFPTGKALAKEFDRISKKYHCK